MGYSGGQDGFRKNQIFLVTGIETQNFLYLE